jgi:hypothetical protein
LPQRLYAPYEVTTHGHRIMACAMFDEMSHLGSSLKLKAHHFLGKVVFSVHHFFKPC